MTTLHGTYFICETDEYRAQVLSFLEEMGIEVGRSVQTKCNLIVREGVTWWTTPREDLLDHWSRFCDVPVEQLVDGRALIHPRPKKFITLDRSVYTRDELQNIIDMSP